MSSAGTGWAQAAAATQGSSTTSTTSSQARDGGEVLSLLTSDDWAAVSAAAGHTVGPDASGQLPKLAPITAYMIAGMRQEGRVAAGTELTAQEWTSQWGDGSTCDPSNAVDSQFLRLDAYLAQQTAQRLASPTAAGLDRSA